MLIAGRVVTGLGAALTFPSVLSIINILFPEEERHRAISIFASVSALGLSLGPFVGGYLVSRYWFGSALLLAVPVSLLALIAVGALVPPSRSSGNAACWCSRSP